MTFNTAYDLLIWNFIADFLTPFETGGAVQPVSERGRGDRRPTRRVAALRDNETGRDVGPPLPPSSGSDGGDRRPVPRPFSPALRKVLRRRSGLNDRRAGEEVPVSSPFLPSSSHDANRSRAPRRPMHRQTEADGPGDLQPGRETARGCVAPPARPAGWTTPAVAPTGAGVLTLQGLISGVSSPSQQKSGASRHLWFPIHL
ncbi:hypothetical protein SKAU_G00303370 [Synaphobranchus kaupii]|uniref:Uncharacterized protein n=1 Tax=Synaphobranchus kaupii TaxID=118154 RepID=A0A9Q1EW58_SYNKA|nr:hypothetical protein SKAU_G00303370 [Synaphobranchus kaupii]